MTFFLTKEQTTTIWMTNSSMMIIWLIWFHLCQACLLSLKAQINKYQDCYLKGKFHCKMPAYNTTKPNGSLSYEGMKKRGCSRKNSLVIFRTSSTDGEKKTKPPSAKQVWFTNQLTKTMVDHLEIYISYTHNGSQNLKDFEKNSQKILPLNFSSSSLLCFKAPLFKYFEAPVSIETLLKQGFSQLRRWWGSKVHPSFLMVFYFTSVIIRVYFSFIFIGVSALASLFKQLLIQLYQILHNQC